MRLGLTLTLAFIGLASLVGLVGYLSDVASQQVLHEVESLRRGSIAEVVGATEMTLALQASQIAAQRLIAERYRARVEPDHESEWGSAEDIDVDEIRDSLDEFAEELSKSWDATRAARELARQTGAGEDDLESARAVKRLVDLEREFAVHRTKMDRFIHLARYHPSDHVREYVVDELEPHYRDKMLTKIRAYEREAKEGLAEDVTTMEIALAAANRRNRSITLLALLSAVALGLLLARSISQPLGKLAAAARQIGQGRLEVPIDLQARNEIGVLAQAFRQMIGDLKATTVSRSHLDNILQTMEEMLIVTDAEDRIRTVNKVALKELQYTEDELLGRPASEILGDDAIWSGESETDQPRGREGGFLTSQGARIPVYCTSSALRDSSGSVVGFVYVAHNVTEQREYEARLRKSLREKEILLKEVHHRVKNNLQVVSSLLDLQNTEASDPELSREVRNSQRRIRSMALIHEQLYRSDDLTSIDFGEYVERLTRHLEHTFGTAASSVSTELDIDAHPLSIDQAIPLGMIVNELVGNALEHAFPDGRGRVVVQFSTEDSRHRLRVSDNGIGLPEHINPVATQSLGLRLVRALADQVGGNVSFRVADGTSVTVEYQANPPSTTNPA